MQTALLLVPDFLLITLGFMLYRHAGWGDAFWSGLEKLIYFVLFPALLFYAITKSPLQFQSMLGLVGASLLVTGVGVLTGYLAKFLFRVSERDFASGVQTAFRFNSYIALALAGRLGDTAGLSAMAVVVGLNIPVVNVVAVWGLARRQAQNIFREILRNPLIIGTLIGLLFNALQPYVGWSIPEVLGSTLQRLANACLALGLIAVGAGLRFSGIGPQRGIVSYWLFVKLALLPIAALGLGRLLQLPLLQQQILLVYAALPTATSAYILASRMGGNGPMVAFIISASTLLSIITLPAWLLFSGINP